MCPCLYGAPTWKSAALRASVQGVDDETLSWVTTLERARFAATAEFSGGNHGPPSEIPFIVDVAFGSENHALAPPGQFNPVAALTRS